MTRLGGVFWFILVIASGITNFLVKQTVQNLDDQLTSVRRQTVAEQKKIHELTADWTYLNQPELLTDLNNRYVHLSQMSPKQAQISLDSIPLRPALSTPLDTAPQVAAAVPPPPAATPNASPVEPAPPARAPIVPVSATVSARVAAAPAASEPPPVRATPSAHAASLDAVFAQVAGDR